MNTKKTSHHINMLNQEIGLSIPDWKPRQTPERITLFGQYCRVEPLDPTTHSEELFNAFSKDPSGGSSTYLFSEPFDSLLDFKSWLTQSCSGADPLFFAIIDNATNSAVGMASYLRITPDHGVIEVGNIHFSTSMQRTAMATEAMFLMMSYAFNELGYRRYEWKCDSCNQPSKNAAERFGFTYEGLFRQAIIYKGRNRDTAWFSIIDKEWEQLKKGYQQWLSPGNFDSDGKQKTGLKQCLDQNSK